MKKSVFIFVMIGVLCIIAACINPVESSPPNGYIELKGKKISLIKGGYHWKTRNGLFSDQMTIADAASPNQIAKDTVPTSIEKNSVVNIEFSDRSTPQLTYCLWEGENRGKEIALDENKIDLPSKSGEYVYEVNATWPKGNASYTLFITVK